MVYRRFLIAVLLFAVGAWAATASADVSDWYLSGQGTWAHPDSARHTDNGWGGTIRLGKTMSEHFDLEGVGTTLLFQRDSGDDRHDFLYDLGVDGLWVFKRGGYAGLGGLSPFLALGGGVTYDNTTVDDGPGGFVAAGGGFRFPIIENGLKLRFDVRYVEDFNSSAWPDKNHFGDVRVSLGVQLPLGVASAPTAPAAPIDSDKDGVRDSRDQCPNTPAGVRVNINGCAMDSDNDGVPDYMDQCPNTPPGTQVNAKGCQLVVDSDGDGVPDDKDQCPNTPAGKPVLTNGCAVGQGTILQGVNFQLSKSTLTPGARNILSRVAQTLKDSPHFQLEIAGYTDSTGSASLNRKLSQARAESVKHYLQQHGVKPGRLKARGYGPSNPIGDNSTSEGRAMNRRVELHVLDNAH